jgi:hypothetical protein
MRPSSGAVSLRPSPLMFIVRAIWQSRQCYDDRPASGMPISMGLTEVGRAIDVTRIEVIRGLLLGQNHFDCLVLRKEDRIPVP